MNSFNILHNVGFYGEKYNSGEDCLLELYREKTESDYNNAAETLSSAGFVKVCDNEIDGNLFSVYVSGDEKVFCGYFPAEKSIRIVADENTELPIFTSEDKMGNTPLKIWQFEVDHRLIDCGMCYLFQCSDNSFIVIDSAHTYSIHDCDRLHDFMRERTPGNEKIRISAWLFTHGHTDHITQFNNYLKYLMNDTVIDGVYFNFVSDEHRDSLDWMDSEKICRVNFYDGLKKHPEIPVYRMHCGLSFFVKDYKITALTSHEDVFPENNEDYNDSSVCFMFEVEGNKILIPGDCAIESSKVMERRYPKFLKADIVQCSHHGHTGTSSNFYRLVGAPIALVPNTEIKYNEEYERIEATRVMAEIAENLYISSNGTVEIPLPLGSGEIKVFPDETFESFDGIKNLWNYEYTPAFKKKKYEEYLARGGKPLDEYKDGFGI